jgi:hypothetical protein
MEQACYTHIAYDIRRNKTTRLKAQNPSGKLYQTVGKVPKYKKPPHGRYFV